MNWRRTLLVGFVGLLLCAAESKQPADDGIIKAPPIPDDDDGFTPPKKFSASKKRATCKKYEGTYISYYDGIYKVENCTTHELLNQSQINAAASRGVKFLPVQGDVIAQLKKGAPILPDQAKVDQASRTCKDLEGRYVTSSYTDVYLVESCKLRAFPDWTSYIEHRRKKSAQRSQVLALTSKEFRKFRAGRDMKSVFGEEFDKLNITGRDVDIIPVDEACEGVNNRDVTYIDKIYRVDNCRKRPYDPELFTKRRALAGGSMKELSAEQWISLPSGAPMPKASH